MHPEKVTPHPSFSFKTIDFLIPLVVAILFFVFVFLFYPFREKLQFDVDEGFNLMRSMLVERGYTLYSDVSSDQPPLFTYLLVPVLRFTGYTINPSRLLVLLFSTLLVWSSAQFLQLTWGSQHAVILPIMFLLLPRYLQVSAAVMIGIPAIALASLSLLFLTIWHLNRRWIWLVLSGIALGLSVNIKLFTGFLAPLFLIGIFVSQYTRYRKSDPFSYMLMPVVYWALSFMSVFLAVWIGLIGIWNFTEVIQPHLPASILQPYTTERHTINFHLKDAYPFLVMALFGLFFTVKNKNWLNLYPFAWASTAYLLLRIYMPVFYHHQLLVTIPSAILGAAALGEAITWLWRFPRSDKKLNSRTLLAFGVLAMFILLNIKALPDLLVQISPKPQISGFTIQAPFHKLKVLQAMREYAPQTNWVVTDMPIYAYLIGRPTPPALATLSGKRLSTGSITEQEILESVEQYNPEQVLMVIFEFPTLEEYLSENYRLVYDKEDFRLFIRSDL